MTTAFRSLEVYHASQTQVVKMSQRSQYEMNKISSAQVTMDDEVDPHLSPEKAGTRLDQLDMRRMGLPQEFRVRISI